MADGGDYEWHKQIGNWTKLLLEKERGCTRDRIGRGVGGKGTALGGLSPKRGEVLQLVLSSKSAGTKALVASEKSGEVVMGE